MLELTIKQERALDLLTDKETKNVGYGGAAGGGKSILGCHWLQIMCTCLNGSKWFIGRDSLKDTRESVLFTWRKVATLNGLTNWKYSNNHIYFNNGSEIEFLDVSFFPQADPMYERLGSKEYTGGWLEEAGSIHPLAFEVLKTRVGRWFNDEFGIPGKVFVTFNPKKNWVDTTFYRPYANKQETTDTRFIPALATDNPYLTKDYMDTLFNIKDKATRARLLDGNFDYDEDPTALISYEHIQNMWTNTQVDMNHRDKCLICDVARFGSDKAIITVWYGWMLYEYHIFAISKTTDIQRCINAMRYKHQIPASRCLADEDGVGGGVVDNCKIVGFRNNAKPINPTYHKIKDECGYRLAERIQDIYFSANVSDEDKTKIEQELAQLKTYESDKDGKLRILPKEKIKQNIGRSPDWLDVFTMRMYYDIANVNTFEEDYKRVLKYI